MQRNDELADSMYELYQQPGMSLAKVGKIWGRSPQTIRKMFLVRGWELKARPGFAPRKISNST